MIHSFDTLLLEYSTCIYTAMEYKLFFLSFFLHPFQLNTQTLLDSPQSKDP